MKHELIEYLRVLSEGKVRPNRKHPGVVRDAKDNIPEIAAVKQKLNEEFGLDLKLINEIKEKLENRHYE